jgi:hypothetical protein
MENTIMFAKMNNRQMSAVYSLGGIFAAAAVMLVVGAVMAASGPKLFDGGQDAVNAFVTALRDMNQDELLTIFGSDANDLINSGDKVADARMCARFLKAYDEHHELEADGNDLTLVVGPNDWPFPIPIVREGQEWVFDANAGREEILSRRIGRNELNTIQVMLAIVDAEREYAMKDRNGDGLLEYAEKFKSDPNTNDGLYWPTKEGQEPSPLGPLVAEARAQGYFRGAGAEGPQPYHGYFYRILTGQGKDAPGGAFDYLVNGKMIGGFAVVAWPAEYGNSGVMTFIVSHDGVVYQKNLGEDTEKTAQEMKLFDPDKTWEKSPTKIED